VAHCSVTKQADLRRPKTLGCLLMDGTSLCPVRHWSPVSGRTAAPGDNALRTRCYLTRWHECWGHLDIAAEDETVELRVGCKPGREFDIESVPGNPPASICPHVAEHEALLARRLPAEVAA
jgi:hypothetical protein